MSLARPFKSRLLCALLATSIIVQSVSCGTILYPERIGQPRGPLDPAVVALDTIGLLLFVVPGAIAFAVDFYNGTIYLPPQEYRCQSPDTISPDQWVSLKLEDGIDTREELQEYLQRQTGQTIELQEGSYRVVPLQSAPTIAPVPRQENPESGPHESFDWKQYFRLHRSTKKPQP